jgi:L-rhamnonate dehydratase
VKIARVEAVRIAYPDPIPNRTPPRPGSGKGRTSSPGTPLRRYAAPDGGRPWMPGGGRDVGCVVTTETGAWGFGMTDYGRATAAIIDDFLAPSLVGENAFATERLYDRMVRVTAGIGSNSLVARAIAAVDLAVWDLKGKVLGQPVYSLLGGPVRESLPLYATGNEIAWQIELGFKHFKRFSPYGPEDGIEGINRLEEEIAAARELIGPDSELMLDFWLGLDIETAVRTAERLRPYRLKWIEDPLLSESIAEYPRLRERLPWKTLATGEHWYGIYPFFDAVARGLIDILQPDIIWVGGLTPLIKICHIAEAAGVSVIPHGGGGTAYGQHACYGLAAIPMIECSGPVMTPPGVPLDEKDRLPGTPVPRAGLLRPSDAPGFGLELLREWLPPFFA